MIRPSSRDDLPASHCDGRRLPSPPEEDAALPPPDLRPAFAQLRLRHNARDASRAELFAQEQKARERRSPLKGQRAALDPSRALCLSATEVQISEFIHRLLERVIKCAKIGCKQRFLRFRTHSTSSTARLRFSKSLFSLDFIAFDDTP